MAGKLPVLYSRNAKICFKCELCFAISRCTQDWPASATKKDEKGNDVGYGFAFEFVEILREKFGFSYEVILPDENILGDATRGIFGLLHSKVRAE